MSSSPQHVRLQWHALKWAPQNCYLQSLTISNLRLRLQENTGKQLWHTPRVPIKGIPEKEHWPKAEQLVSLLHCQPGRPVATQVLKLC